jgi:hypothetical protein
VGSRCAGNCAAITTMKVLASRRRPPMRSQRGSAWILGVGAGTSEKLGGRMPPAAGGILASIHPIGAFHEAAPKKGLLAPATTSQDRRARASPWLAAGPVMCDNVTHERDLDQGAAPAYRCVGASDPEARIDSRPRSTHAGRDPDARQRRASDQRLRAMETAEAIREGPRPPRRRDARRGHHQPRSRPLKPSPCRRQPPRISMPHWLRSST